MYIMLSYSKYMHTKKRKSAQKEKRKEKKRKQLTTNMCIDHQLIP